MKTIYTCLATITIVFASLPAIASPRGGSNQAIDYLDRDSEHNRLSIGTYYHGRKRNVTIDGTGIAGELQEDRFVGYGGYDLQHWLTVYGITGWNIADLGDALTPNSDSDLVIGISLGMDLFTHEIQETVIMEDKFRINSSISLFKTEFDVSGSGRNYLELDAQLTFSFVNDTKGSKFYFPESIALFVGPIYNDLISGDIDERDDRFGVTAGLEFYSAERVSVGFRYEQHKKSGFVGGFNIHF